MYDLIALRTNVRNMLQNVGPISVPDAVIDTACLQGKRMLDQDRGDTATFDIPGNNSTKYFKITGVWPNWLREFSTIQSLINPSFDPTASEYPAYADQSDWRLLEKDGNEYLFYLGGINTGTTATVEYGIQWQIKDMDGAVQTTITGRVLNALEFASAEMLCLALAAKSAGVLDDQIMGSQMIDWRTKQQEYDAAAKSYHTRYLRSLNLDVDKARAIVVRADYNPVLPQTGWPYLTHNWRLR